MAFDKTAYLLSDVFESKFINIYVKYTASIAGRDKAYLFIQYFSRFLIYTLNQQKIIKPSASSIATLSKIQASMAETRKSTNPILQKYKFLRLGKFVDNFKLSVAAVKDPTSDCLTRLISSLSKLLMGIYVLCDGIVWFNSTGIFKLKNIQKISKLSTQCSLASVILSFLNGLYIKLSLNLRMATIASIYSPSNTKYISDTVDKDKDTLSLIEKEKNSINSKLLAINKQLPLDIIDMIIPANVLGIINFNDGVIGAIGTLTSVIGANDLISKISP
ncbi:Peroxisomal membrane protein 11A [Smittium culicis]|uniref:Peroxisomal membrane protein 11A n=1 Tax=Smittium culicis TaxID=133412 RepID=A0A1R1YPK2_9FUNG|nr:Peroxisomal membrane protein 11A [Smittium culicis]